MNTSSATHITVQPDLSGWGFTTTIEEQENVIRRHSGTFVELVHYCRHHGLPVVVEAGTERWCQQTYTRLTNQGIVVLTETEDYELHQLDLYWMNRCEAGDRIEFEPTPGNLFWGKVTRKGRRYLEVLPDAWAGTTFVAGREVRTLTVKGPK